MYNEYLVEKAFNKAKDGIYPLEQDEYYAVLEYAKYNWGETSRMARDVLASCKHNPELTKYIFYGRDTRAEESYGSMGNDPHTTSGCFITTACMEFMSDSFDDDCYELNTLREFRDTYLKEHHPDLVKEYYEIAPSIVEAINAQDNRADIYNEIYFKMVLPSIDAYLAGQYETAMKIYRDYAFRLKEMFVEVRAE